MRLSRPLMDRIDLHIEVPALSYDEIAGSGASGPTSAEVRETVQRVRDIQRDRYQGAFTCNAHLDPGEKIEERHFAEAIQYRNLDLGVV